MSSCLKHKANHTVNENIINIQLDNMPYFIKPDTVFSDITYIPLETTDESVFYNIDKISYHNDRFYILDRKQAAILVFEKTGKYVKKLARTGQGPSEYLSLEDFFIKDDLLYILSSSLKKIIIYNDAFEFEKDYSIGTFATNIQCMDNYIFVYSNFSANDFKNIYVVDINTGKTFKKYVDFHEKQKGVRYRTSGFAKDRDSLYITFPYEYSIYRMKPDGYSEFYTVDFGKEYMYPPQWSKLSDDERTEKQSALYADFFNLPVSSIDNLNISDKYIAFTFVHRVFQHKFILNRNTGHFSVGYIIASEQYPFTDGEFLGMIDDKLIISVHSDRILENFEIFKKNNHKLNPNTSFVDRLDPEDNPVICIYTLNY